METSTMLPPAGTSRPFTGRKAFLVFLGFFLFVTGANAIMIYGAVTTFSGLDAGKPYESGLRYNDELRAAKAQAERAWTVEARLVGAGEGHSIEVTMRDAAGVPLIGFDVTATLRSPVDRARDVSTVLGEIGGGDYRGEISAPSGRWDLVIEASRDGERLFRSENRVMIE